MTYLLCMHCGQDKEFQYTQVEMTYCDGEENYQDSHYLDDEIGPNTCCQCKSDNVQGFETLKEKEQEMILHITKDAKWSEDELAPDQIDQAALDKFMLRYL